MSGFAGAANDELQEAVYNVFTTFCSFGAGQKGAAQVRPPTLKIHEQLEPQNKEGLGKRINVQGAYARTLLEGTGPFSSMTDLELERTPLRLSVFLNYTSFASPSLP